MAEAIRKVVSACVGAMNDDRGLADAREIARDPGKVDGGTPAHFQEQHVNTSTCQRTRRSPLAIGSKLSSRRSEHTAARAPSR